MIAVFQEMDLYPPVRDFLEERGYRVQAEVKDCDIAASNGEELLIVELKKAFNLKLVYQAMERQRMTDYVYVAIARSAGGQRRKAWQDMLRLLKRLDLGLLVVSIDSPVPMVEVICEPQPHSGRKDARKRRGLLAEFEARQVDDSNVGGQTRRKVMTAYREKSVELCCILESREMVSYKELREMEKDGKYTTILRNNVYQWFTRLDKGVYAISDKGRLALEEADNRRLVAYYRGKFRGGNEE